MSSLFSVVRPQGVRRTHILTLREALPQTVKDSVGLGYSGVVDQLITLGYFSENDHCKQTKEVSGFLTNFSFRYSPFQNSEALFSAFPSR